MRLHMLGLPHTRTTSEFSHCAFTGKVRRWAKMMSPLGYECIHYGVGEPDSPGWAEHIDVMPRARQEQLLGYDPAESGPRFVGQDANVGHPLYADYNHRLSRLLRIAVKPGDIICAPFGHGHEGAFKQHIKQTVETGIGYPECCCAYRIYESQGWFAWHVGKEHRQPWDSEWVVPNYYDLEEWPLRKNPAGVGEFVLFMGRLGALKGLHEIQAIARERPDEHFVICGQGDPEPFLKDTPNLTYMPPVHGMARAKLMHRAKCLLMPSRFLEPFGGVAVEAMLTGTPVLTTNFGAFVETIPYSWMRCNTLSDFLFALGTLDAVRPGELRMYAQSQYTLEAVGPMYDRIFQKIPAMWEKGWYA